MSTKSLKLGTCLLALTLTSTAAFAADVYGPYPITVKGYTGDKTNSVSYTGQVARSVLVESLKKLAGKGDGGANAAEIKAEMLKYFEGSDDKLAILAPKDKDGIDIKQSYVTDISKGKNVVGKFYDGAMPAWPGNKTGREVIAHIIDQAAKSNGGFDANTGYDYGQLIQKFALGAMAYNQVVDNYLDENLTAEKKPNGAPYSDGAAYTGKEHSWDEAFGYFGAAAHTLTLSADENYSVNKLKDAALADANKDGVIDLKSEMVFGNAYYAASFDRLGKTDYLATITQAFVDGRKLITSAQGENLTDEQRTALQAYAKTIGTEWEKVIAEASFKYAGSVYKDIAKIRDAANDEDRAKAYRDYAKHWSELKGFSMALQSGKNNLGSTGVQLNRLIGFGPVTMDETYVTGVDADGNFLKDKKLSWNGYQLHMLRVQSLLVKAFGIQARDNDATADLAELVKELDTDSGGSETD
jgi:hypothetical protein